MSKPPENLPPSPDNGKTETLKSSQLLNRIYEVLYFSTSKMVLYIYRTNRKGIKRMNLD